MSKGLDLPLKSEKPSILKSLGSFLDRKFGIISILPMLLIIGVVIIYPIIYLFYLSFTDTSNMNLIANNANFIGLKNFIRHFKDKAFITSIWNTLYFTAVSVSLSTLIGLFLACIVYPMISVRKNLMVTCILLPTLIAETACALIFKPMLDTSIGIFNYMLTFIHLPAINFLGDKVSAQWVIIALNVWQWAPYMFVFLLSGIESLSISYFEVLRLEGATFFQRLWYVILPLIKPIALVAIFFRITNSLRLFDKIYILTGGGPGSATDTITSYIQRVGILRMEFGYSSAGGVIMLLITAVIGAITLKYMYNVNE
ncbi:MAG TPA: sugar ABC transporter permease [Ruminiclostridium sp.]